jgi:hypothetical protein
MSAQPDIWWDGVPHQQIVDWTNKGHGVAVTETLEARLTLCAEALTRTSDLANSVLQRVSGGEWTGNAATVVAAAVQVLRDFDDLMGHHGEMNTLAAYGQSDNASWARTNVPPVVDVRPPQNPTGLPVDALNSTVDYHSQVRAARDAEEQARQVMRAYEDMTKDRIAALPPLPTAPQVVVNGAESTITVSQSGHVQPFDASPVEHEHPAAPPQPGDEPGPVGAPPPPPPPPPPQAETFPLETVPLESLPLGIDPSDTDPFGTSPSNVTDSLAPSPAGASDGSGSPRAAAGGFGAVAGAPGAGPLRGGGGLPGGQPVGAGDPGARAGTRVTEMPGRSTTRGVPAGVAPVATPGARRPEEDRDHEVRYPVLGSELFEPDTHHGLLRDPYRPGSYVAPASIGDEDVQ